MWDFEHSPLREELATRYELQWMLPSECADQLATGQAEIGLIPIAALATNPHLRILPGCVIASKGRVRSLLLVRRARQPLHQIRTVAADTASRTTIAHSRILFHKWGNPAAEFLPMAADLDAMLDRADAAIVIGDPALMALEEQANRFERSGEELVYHDLAAEWKTLTGLPFVSAVWCCAHGGAAHGNPGAAHGDPAFGGSESIGLQRAGLTFEEIAADFIRSRDHGLAHIDALVEEWNGRITLPEETLRTYLTENIHYVLDEECVEAMKTFFRLAAECGVLPEYQLKEIEQA